MTTYSCDCKFTIQCGALITGRQYQQRIYMGDKKTCSWHDTIPSSLLQLISGLIYVDRDVVGYAKAAKGYQLSI